MSNETPSQNFVNYAQGLGVIAAIIGALFMYIKFNENQNIIMAEVMKVDLEAKKYDLESKKMDKEKKQIEFNIYQLDYKTKQLEYELKKIELSKSSIPFTELSLDWGISFF
jgi:uncharacterized protein (DUF3084 family)